MSDLIEHESLADSEQELWTALQGRMLDKSPLVRREAIDSVIGLLIKGKGNRDVRNQLLELLLLIASDDRHKVIGERIIMGVYDLWTENNVIVKKNPNSIEHQQILDDFKAIIRKDEISLEMLCSIVLKLQQKNKDLITKIFTELVNVGMNILKQNKSEVPILLEVLAVFSSIVPESLESHLPYLLCYLNPDTASEDNPKITRSVCFIIEKTTIQPTNIDYDTYKKAQIQLMQLTCVTPLSCLELVVQALAGVIQRITFDEVIVASILEKAIILLQVQTEGIEKEKLPSVYRSLSLIGYLCYFFDFEKLKTLRFTSDSDIPFSQQLFTIFKDLYNKVKYNPTAQDKVLESISYLWLRYPNLLTESEDMVIAALNRNKKPDAIKRTLQMIYKMFQGGAKISVLPNQQQSTDNTGIQIAQLVPKLFDNLESFTKCEDEEVRFWAFMNIKLLADKGFANHTRLLDIFYVLLADTSQKIAEGSYCAIEDFAQKKNSLLSINLKERIKNAFTFAYKIYKGDLNSLISQNLNCPFMKYFMLFPNKDRSSFIDSLLEVLFDTSEENVKSSLVYSYIMWILFSMEYSEPEKQTIINKLTNFVDSNQTLVIENLKKRKKGKKTIYLGLIVSRIEIMLDMIKAAPSREKAPNNDNDEDPEEIPGGYSKTKSKGKSKFRMVKTKLAKHLEKIEELEKSVDEQEPIPAAVYNGLKNVCKEIRRIKESTGMTQPIENEEKKSESSQNSDEKETAKKSNKKSMPKNEEDTINSVEKRKRKKATAVLA